MSIKIILRSATGLSNWTTTLELETGGQASPKMLILELPSRAKQPAGEMRQFSDTKSEFTVHLEGDASSATITDLSSTPLQDWMTTMLRKFGICAAAIAVVVKNGKTSVILRSDDHE